MLAAGICCSPAALADDGASPNRGWHAAADVGTNFPVDVHVRGQVETPFRLRLSTSLGYLPPPYVQTINGFLIGVGAYTQDTGKLIESALSSSLAWRTHLGFRPIPSLGLHFEAGYGLVTLGGGASGSELLAAVTGANLPTGGRSFEITSSLHMLDVEVGWEAQIVEHLHLRAALGGAFTLASSTRVAAKGSSSPAGAALLRDFTKQSEAYLDETYTSYVHTPVVSVGIGYVFF